MLALVADVQEREPLLSECQNVCQALLSLFLTFIAIFSRKLQRKKDRISADDHELSDNYGCLGKDSVQKHEGHSNGCLSQGR